MRQKKAVVTGAGGFLGMYLLKALLQNGYQVWAVLHRTGESIHWLVKHRVHIVLCDMDEVASLPIKIVDRGFDCFYHLAWEGSFGDKRGDYHLQMRNARNSADAVFSAKEIGCRRFVGAGSITECMYGTYLKQDKSKPDMVVNYAIGKMAAEYLCRCVAVEAKMEYIWGYLANFYGPGDRTGNFISFLLKHYLNSEIPNLTEGEQQADFTYVSDVAKGLLAMGEHGTDGNTYYVGYGKPMQLKDFVAIVHNVANPTIDSGIGKKKFHGLSVDYGAIDIGKLERETQFRASITFEQGIGNTLDWIRNGEKSIWTA